MILHNIKISDVITIAALYCVTDDESSAYKAVLEFDRLTVPIAKAIIRDITRYEQRAGCRITQLDVVAATAEEPAANLLNIYQTIQLIITEA